MPDKPDIHSLLISAVEEYEHQTKEVIQSLDHEGLVKYAKTRIKKVQGLEFPQYLRTSMPYDFMSSVDAVEWIDRSRKDWYIQKNLYAVVTRLLSEGKVLPYEIVEYVLKTELGLEKKHKWKSIKNTFIRNEEICRCIRDIAKHTELKPQRGESKNDEQKITAISILAEATGLEYTYIETLYKRRGEHLKGAVRK